MDLHNENPPSPDENDKKEEENTQPDTQQDNN